MAHLKLIKGRYYGYYLDSNGKYRSRSMKTSNATIAKQRLKELEKLEYEIKIGVREDSSAAEKMQQQTLYKVVESFFSDQKNLIRPSTVQRYQDSLNELILVFGKDKPIRSFVKRDYAMLTEALINAEKPDPKMRILKQRFTLTTVNIMLRGIRRFFNWAVENDYLEKLPFKVRMLRLEKKPPKFMTDDEVTRFLDKAKVNMALHDLYLVFLETGMRRDEIHNSELLPDGRHLRITKTKGHKDRIIPIPDKIASLYQKAKDRSYENSYVTRQFKRFVHQAGLSDEFSLHSLRHTFAVRHWVKYRDINLTKEVLGHSSVTTTEVYTKIPASYLANVIASRDNQ
jgi:integrase